MRSLIQNKWSRIFSSKSLYMIYINYTIMRNENIKTIDKSPMQGLYYLKKGEMLKTNVIKRKEMFYL